MTTDTAASDRNIDRAARFLQARGFGGPYDLALVLGTGLGPVAEAFEDPVVIAYSDIPAFPHGAVSGHAHELVTGRIEGRRVLAFQGRVHFYETGDAAAMRVPIGVVRALGAPPLLLTNAAGSLKPDLGPGSLVLVSDHIALGGGANPLIGERSEARFVSMTDAYDPRLRDKLRRAARSADVRLGEGVYMWFSGPSFETPAEVRMAGILGADLVGMSTVPEVILARSWGVRVAAVSVVTNLAAGIAGASPNHGETKSVAAGAAQPLRRLIQAFCREPDDV